MYKISEIPAYTSIGNQGESGVKTLTFDITEWQADFPEIVCAITMIAPSGGAPYLLAGVSQSGNVLTWVVGHDATENDGTATIVIRGLIGDAEKRSAVAPVIIAHGHPAAGEAPAAVQDWIDEATVLKSEIEAAETAHDEAYAGAETARDELYTTAEGARNDLYTAAETARDGRYETAEAARDGLYATAEEGRAAAELLRDSAESGRVSAEAARVSAESGRIAAESSRVSAESLRAAAEATRETDTADAIADCEAAAAYAYDVVAGKAGIRWDKASAQCVRTGMAAGITTTTTNFGHFGSLNASKANPFDEIYPWSGMRLCNIDIDAYYALVEAGGFSTDDLLACVTAWEGDPDFDYDDADGVWRYRPEFWGSRTEDATYVYLDVTDKPLGGYVHYPATIEGRWYGGIHTRTVDSSPVSCLLPKPGMPGKNVAMSTLHTYAKNFDATLDSIFSVDADTLLYLVEYANFDMQLKLGTGVSSLYKQGGYTLKNSPSASAVVQVLVANGSGYCIQGAIMDIGTSDGGAQVGSYIISTVEVDGTDPTLYNVTLTTDGTTPASITATTANYWSIHGLQNVSDEDIGSDSGYIGTNGKSNVYYRGAVMFGNMWKYILGAYRESGSTSASGNAEIWIANDDEEADAYDALNKIVHRNTGLALPATSGYINALGALSVSGLLCIPPFCTTVGGSSSNPVGDYCYVPTVTDADRILRLGGYANYGSNAGPFYGGWDFTASSAGWYIAARPRLKTPSGG